MAVVLNETEKKKAKEALLVIGVCEVLAESAADLGWKAPSEIQAQSIPQALQGKDVIGLAQTGSGKTGAFALPILQELLDKPQAFFALVLSPTRELAIQIAEQFEALGAGIGVKTAVLVGGIDMMAQSIQLGKRPHVVVGTPGRVVDLTRRKGFTLRRLRVLCWTRRTAAQPGLRAGDRPDPQGRPAGQAHAAVLRDNDEQGGQASARVPP